MQKTVIYEEIDGHEIVRGFDTPVMDAVATNKIVLGYRDDNGVFVPGKKHDTDEHKAAEAKKTEYAEAVKALSDIKTTFRISTKGALQRASREVQEKWNTALGKMSVRQDELKPLARDLEEKVIVLRLENAVYFEPRKGEVIIEASEADKLLKAMQGAPDGVLIARDGSEVRNSVGTVFFRKSGKPKRWGRTQIFKLGDAVPEDALLESALTESQWDEIELDLAATLPEEDKVKAKAGASDEALKTAAELRSNLEIQGDADALKKSQEHYRKRMDRIKKLYG